MQKIIEFEDKVALNENSSIPEINKITDNNINEIKSIVNGSLQGTNAMGSIVVDDVKCKNMLNKNVFSNSYLNNGVETSSPQSALFNYIQVKPNTQYTFSSSSSIRYLAIYEFNDTKTYLTTQLSENTSNYSFTTGNNTKYIRIDINKDASATMTQSVIDTLTPQLELGSTPTTYTPFINIIKEQNGYVKEDTTFYANDFKCRNLLPNNNTTQTINGVTFTVNSDKSVTVNGTATANTGFPLIGGVNIYDSLGLENNNYTLSGCPSGGSETGYSIYMGVKHSNSSVTNYYDTGNTISFTKQTGDTIYAIIRVGNGTTVSNKTFYPQIEAGSEVTPYTPHKDFENKEIYSTNEIKVGTWTNGKPIYRKVVTGTSSSTSGGDTTVPFTCDTLIKFEPFLIAGDSILPLNFYNDANTRGLCYKSGNNILIRVWGNQYFLGKNFYIILEYTKTADIVTRSIEMEKENNDNR